MNIGPTPLTPAQGTSTLIPSFDPRTTLDVREQSRLRMFLQGGPTGPRRQRKTDDALAFSNTSRELQRSFHLTADACVSASAFGEVRRLAFRAGFAIFERRSR
jgi:hypothetical protein